MNGLQVLLLTCRYTTVLEWTPGNGSKLRLTTTRMAMSNLCCASEWRSGCIAGTGGKKYPSLPYWPRQTTPSLSWQRRANWGSVRATTPQTTTPMRQRLFRSKVSLVMTARNRLCALAASSSSRDKRQSPRTPPSHGSSRTASLISRSVTIFLTHPHPLAILT